MESNPVVFDISSDDDDEVASGLEESKGDDYDWFSEVLEAVNKGFDDSDEVVVIGEVNPNKKSKTRNSSVRKDVTEEDDDCIVLEGDPEKAVSDVNDYHDDSDELLVVGHKGQVACRDFPHPRHDCAKFPFSSTSHDQHCELCHCFVCDVRAPCCYWGSGITNTDHCHATDKEEIWSTLRKNFRHGRNVSVPPVTSHSTVVPQHNHVLHRDIIRLTTQNHVSRPTPVRASGNCIPQNNVPRPSIIRACSSSSTKHGVPYNPTVGSRHVLNRSTIQPRSGSQELLGVRNSVIQRDRGTKTRNMSSQFVSSNTMSKRLDTEVPATVTRNAFVPPENIENIISARASQYQPENIENITSAHASQYQRNPASVTTSNERNPNLIVCPNNSDTSLGTHTYQSSSQPRMDPIFANSAPSLYPPYNLCVPQSNVYNDTSRVQNQSHPATYNGFSDFDINWVNNIDLSNQQSSADYLQFQTSGSTNGEGPFKVNGGDKSYYNELESLLLDNQCAPGGSLTAGLNAPSPPDHIPLETGLEEVIVRMLFRRGELGAQSLA
ncbi:hypothetical protein E1A91_D08G058700v1 [Gossypium mustelinum]|uniref:RPM1 interacting protein 13 n=1 Tax=Gossypium mustelinum TaxID=34275 RepID=A0A5D2TV21_GOSMU|nr:hypothetical protein E1A91_D08G058700v1 [Gossypium mustelinum]